MSELNRIEPNSNLSQVLIAVFTTTFLHQPTMASGRLSTVLVITSALLHLPLAPCHPSCFSGADFSTVLVFTTTLLHLPAMASGHPCLSEAGLTSAICSRLIQHCSSPLGSKSAACQVSRFEAGSSLMFDSNATFAIIITHYIMPLRQDPVRSLLEVTDSGHNHHYQHLREELFLQSMI